MICVGDMHHRYALRNTPQQDYAGGVAGGHLVTSNLLSLRIRLATLATASLRRSRNAISLQQK
jgi:hypothetical protein